jgi:hypothetical protein
MLQLRASSPEEYTAPMNIKPAKIVAFVVFAFAAALATYFSIESVRQDSDNAPVRPATDTASLRDAEFIALASIKYGIEETTIRKLLKEYDEVSKTRPEFRGAVIELSGKYDIKREVIAEILLKRKEWTGKEEPSGVPPMPDDDWDRWIRWDRQK